jgi:hypothetical protein
LIVPRSKPETFGSSAAATVVSDVAGDAAVLAAGDSEAIGDSAGIEAAGDSAGIEAAGDSAGIEAAGEAAPEVPDGLV